MSRCKFPKHPSAVKRCAFLLLIVCLSIGCEADRITTEILRQIQPIHFTFEFGDDIATDERFDTQAERDTYRKVAIAVLEALFADFQVLFGLGQSHVKVIETVIA